jgi:hypothetical protein
MALKDRHHQDTGRKGYREAHEYPDDRPCINHSPFWTGDEQTVYEAVVRENPIREDDNLDSYLSRIASIAAGRYVKPGPGRPMPTARPTQAEYTQRVMKLERQREPGDDTGFEFEDRT